MDLESLLQSRGDESPSGDDLEYDPDFAEMEIAAQPGEERQVGDTIEPGEDPEYKKVVEKAMSVLERSHDLRAAIFLAEAKLSLDGLPAFAECTTYVRRCLEEYWDTCHPQLDEEDDNDPTMRVNAVVALRDPDRTLRRLRNAPLSASRMMGAFSLRQMQVADGEAQPGSGEEIPDKQTIRASFEDSDPELMATVSEAAKTALADVRAISGKFDAETPGQGPDLDDLIKMLQQINARLQDMVGGDVAPEDLPQEDAGGGAVAAGGGGGGAVGGVPGAINSSTDVTAALERIIAYYDRSEPSSPVPILLERAKKLVNADFLTIMKDMAPRGVENVHLIAGIEDE